MLNQIEKQFEGFVQAMYGRRTISQAQESDIEKSFYAGMLVCVEMLHAFDDNEDIAVVQLETLYKQIHTKMGEIAR